MKMVDKIASDLCLDQDYIASVVKRSRFYYRDYYIDKRDGGKRKISQPSSELKTMQYWVKKNILSKLPVSDSAIKKELQLRSTLRFTRIQDTYFTQIFAVFFLLSRMSICTPFFWKIQNCLKT